MFHWIALHEATLIGVIFMLVIGPAVGNYACSVIYRLPLGRTPFERHPFCGHCDADLKPIDLFPILSWISTRGRCRYCSGPIPALYTCVEIACACIFVGYFLQFGMGELFLLYAAYGVFVVILAAIQWQQGWIASSVLGYALVCIALIRTMQEGTIHGWFQSGFIALIAALVWQRVVTFALRQPFMPFATPWIWWVLLLGMLVPRVYWILLGVPLAILVLFRLLPARWRALAVVPIAVCALYLPVLIPLSPI